MVHSHIQVYRNTALKLIKRYEKYVAEMDREEWGAEEEAGPHASDNPMMVMVDESTGNKYMRTVPHKGLGVDISFRRLGRFQFSIPEAFSPVSRSSSFIVESATCIASCNMVKEGVG